jgi:predicted Zn-dependent protease
MSTKIKQQYGVQGLGALASILGVSSNTVALGQAAASYGLNFANLKYSRDNENEADHLGLIFAAMAGYDPNVAVKFWERMAAASGNKGTAEFLSDHPSDATRIKNIQGWLPEAMKYYKPATTTTKKTTTKKSTTKKTTTKKTSTKKSK